MSQSCQQPHIIAFIGTVGAGKSTQIKLLASKLRKKGLKIKTTSIKTNNFFARLLTLILACILVKSREDVYPIRALIEDKPVIFKRLFKLWLALDLFSFSLKFLLVIYLPTMISYTVLVEEYIPATISDYVYLSKAIGFPFKASSFVARFMLKLMHTGNPTHIVFLNASLGTLRSRWRSRGSLDEKSDYLHMQRTILRSLSKKLSSHELLYINTDNRTIGETQELIVSYFMKHIFVKDEA